MARRPCARRSSSLVGQGAEAIWVGGDNTVLASLDAVIGPARSAEASRCSPAFPDPPPAAPCSTSGADYLRVGKSIGRLAGRVLDGESPADHADPLRGPARVLDQPARSQVDRPQAGAFPPRSTPRPMSWSSRAARSAVTRERRTAPGTRLGPSRTWKVGLACFSESPMLEELVAGLRRGLKEAGLVEGRDYTTTYRNAQGDIATLNALIDEFNGDDTDLVVSFSTPALQAAVRKVDRKPVVFAGVLDPIAAGAGKSDADHRANVTGRLPRRFPMPRWPGPCARSCRPRGGSALCSLRPRSTRCWPGSGLSSRSAAEGLELVSLPVNGPTEVTDAALGLCQSGVDVICQISDSLSNSAFPAISRACRDGEAAAVYVLALAGESGAILAVGSDYAENGRDAGRLAAEVIRGRDPSRIPFHATTHDHPLGQPRERPPVRRHDPGRMDQVGRRGDPRPARGEMKGPPWNARSAAPPHSPRWSSSAASIRPGRRIYRTGSTRWSGAGPSRSASTWPACPISAPTGSASWSVTTASCAKIGGRLRIVADSDAVEPRAPADGGLAAPAR